jgi:hypothetical protein
MMPSRPIADARHAWVHNRWFVPLPAAKATMLVQQD